MKNLMVLGLVLVSISLSACGKSASDAEKADVAKVTAAISKMFTPGNTGIMLENMKGIQKKEIRFDEMSWQDGAMILDAQTCSSFTSAFASSASGCAASCTAGQSVLGINCTIPTSNSYVCGTTIYTASNGTLGLSMDFAGVTVSGDAGTGTFKLGLTFGADVKGGSLDGKLECAINFNIDLATVATSFNPVIDCSNFSCKYDGKDIACADLTAQTNSCKI